MIGEVSEVLGGGVGCVWSAWHRVGSRGGF